MRSLPFSERSAIRYVHVHLPSFPLERAGIDADEPAVCVALRANRLSVVAMTAAARRGGVVLGMGVVEARALIQDLDVIEQDVEGERQDHRELLLSLASFGERPSLWPAWDVSIEVGRTSHLMGGEEALASQIHRHVAALGHDVTVGVGDDPWLARLAAMWIAPHEQACVVLPSEGVARWIAELPFEALDPSRALYSAAQAIGVERVGQWAALDRASVVGRFGSEGQRLHRLACGEPARESVGPLDSPVDAAPWVERVVLGGPTVDLQPVLFVLPGLIRRLFEHLWTRDSMAMHLLLRLDLDGATHQDVRIRVGEPSRDPERWISLFQARLERLRLSAPVVALQLEVVQHTAERGVQLHTLERRGSAEPIADLIVRLQETLGERSVFRPVERASWRPERAWSRDGRADTLARRLEERAPPEEPLARHHKAAQDPVARLYAFEAGGVLPRPILLLPVPEQVAVETVDGRPARVRWSGRWWRVECGERPERIETGWWEVDGGLCRDYWTAALISEGSARSDAVARVAWCFADDIGRWFLHGWFD
jgi:protein ImuB